MHTPTHAHYSYSKPPEKQLGAFQSFRYICNAWGSSKPVPDWLGAILFPVIKKKKMIHPFSMNSSIHYSYK